MKPIMILPPGAMDDENVKLLRENDLCVVIAKEPAAVKFLDPIPAASSRTDIEEAAIQLSRRLLRGELVGDQYRSNIARLYVDLLVKGTPLDPGRTKAEIEKEIFDDAKCTELRRLAREEAKAERAAAKQQAKSK